MTDSMFAARPDDKKLLEEGDAFAPKFDADGLIPVIAIEADTSEVLMFAFMNHEALQKTLEIGEVVYYSRSRQKLWHKGEESGNVQKVVEVRTDCDQDVLQIKVKQVGGAACHCGYRSCFFRKIDLDTVSTARPLGLITTETEKVFDPAKVYKK